MEKEKKTYEIPNVEVLEVKFEGVICESSPDGDNPE